MGTTLKSKKAIRGLLRFALAGIGLALLTTGGRPQTPMSSQANGASPAQSDPKPDTFYAKGATYDAKTGMVIGHDFRYATGDMVITGATGRYNRPDKILDAEGSLTMDDPKHHVTSDRGHLDDVKKLGTLLGNVVMTLKPESDSGASATTTAAQSDTQATAATPGGTGLAPVTPPAGLANGKKPEKDKDRERFNTDRKKGGVVTCDRVDDFYRRKYVYLRGHVVAHQRFAKDNGKMLERTLTAQHAEYDIRNDKLYLFPPVHVQDSDGNLFDSPKERVTLGTKEGEETMEGKELNVTFFPNHDEEPNKKNDSKKDGSEDGAVPPPPPDGNP